MADVPKDQLPDLVVFADDWGRHPSSCQHLVQRLLDRYRVLWVNTIGMRIPRLDLSSFRRAAEKLRHWSGDAESHLNSPDNLRVINPKMWPWFSSSLDRRLNRELLCRQLKASLRKSHSPVVAITTLPIVADLLGRLPVERWVYYAVDDFSEWPGMDKRSLQRMESQLVRRADVCIAVSDVIRDKLAAMGRDVSLLTHGIDLDHWSRNGHHRAIPELASFERPLVVFWGAIDRRLDLEFLRRLGQDLEHGTIALVGPICDPDPALFRCPRVRRVPAVSYDLLPQLAQESAVLIMPYADLPVTRAIQPLKLKEYLATGRPAIVRNLPSVRSWSDCLDVCETPESFSACVSHRLATGLPADQLRARKRLDAESWTGKALQFERYALDMSSTHVAHAM